MSAYSLLSTVIWRSVISCVPILHSCNA